MAPRSREVLLRGHCSELSRAFSERALSQEEEKYMRQGGSLENKLSEVSRDHEKIHLIGMESFYRQGAVKLFS